MSLQTKTTNFREHFNKKKLFEKKFFFQLIFHEPHVHYNQHYYKFPPSEILKNHINLNMKNYFNVIFMCKEKKTRIIINRSIKSRKFSLLFVTIKYT